VEGRAGIERRCEEGKRRDQGLLVARAADGGLVANELDVASKGAKHDEDQGLKRGKRRDQLRGEKPHRVTALEVGDFMCDE